MMDKNVYEIIGESAKKWPDKVAIYDETSFITFIDLQNEVERLKAELKNNGIKPGMGIGVMGRNSKTFIISVFAVLGCEAIVFPISHQIKSAELYSIIFETKLHGIIDDQNGVIPPLLLINKIKVCDQILRLTLAEQPWQNKIAPHIDHPAFIRFTSGTTGKSKGVIVSHASVFERIEAANKGLMLGEQDTVVWVLPMAYHFIVSIVLYLKYGVVIAICNDFLASSILDCSNQYNGTLLYASPMHIRLLANDKSDHSFHSLKKVISTSTSIALGISKDFEKRFGKSVSQAYGIIEIGLPIINFKKSEEFPDSVGFALPDYQVEILDDDYNSLNSGETGLLAIKGPGMFDGYLNPPCKKEEVLKKGWFITGDLAVKSADGMITVVGRKKAMINVSGNKVFPEEVEAVIESHPSVNSCKVIGGNHPLMGEIVEAEILLIRGMTIQTEEIISYCREKLSTYKIPQRIRFVDHIETTGSGKKIRG